MNPYQMMIRSLGQKVKREEVDVILHAGEFGPLVISQVITGEDHLFVMIRAATGQVFCFHLDVLSRFPTEVKPKNDPEGLGHKRIGFRPTGIGDQVTEL